MKIVSILTAVATMILISGTANAMIHPDGTFVPTQCGQPAESADAAVQAVCFGTIVGDSAANRIVEFRMGDQSVRQFKVLSQANLMMALASGNVKAMYYLVGAEGAKATMKVIQTRAGVVASVSGELESTSYFVPKMETMLTIQGF